MKILECYQPRGIAKLAFFVLCLGMIPFCGHLVMKDEETSENLTATEIARDGIAVVVNNDNDVDELTSDQVKSIFTGETTDWEDLAK